MIISIHLHEIFIFVRKCVHIRIIVFSIISCLERIRTFLNIKRRKHNYRTYHIGHKPEFEHNNKKNCINYREWLKIITILFFDLPSVFVNTSTR